MLEPSKSSQNIKSSKKNQSPQVSSSLSLGFVVTHEMTISVKSVDNIGYLVDNILKRSGITLKNFEWKALQVTICLTKAPKTHE